jgi:hypothetical protein
MCASHSQTPDSVRVLLSGSAAVELRLADPLSSHDEISMLYELWHALLALPLSIEM